MYRAFAVLALVACHDSRAPTGPTEARSLLSIATDTVPVTMIGAGDVHGACTKFNKASLTAPLVAADPTSLVYVVGDNAGIHGTAAEFRCYHQTWGAFKDRTHFVIGNHERNQDTAATAYYDYANGVGVDSGPAGKRGQGFHAITYGGWRVLFLNSEQLQTEQAAWIRGDLAANPTLCQVAFWHKPLFTSSINRRAYFRVRPMWKALQDKGAELVVAAHDHNYQRYAKVRSDGVFDPIGGLRQIVAGSGGGVLMAFNAVPHPAAEKLISTHGVLRLVLYVDRYEWEFRGITGEVLDSGGDVCH